LYAPGGGPVPSFQGEVKVEHYDPDLNLVDTGARLSASNPKLTLPPMSGDYAITRSATDTSIGVYFEPAAAPTPPPPGVGS
jgi:hypothetical protein